MFQYPHLYTTAIFDTINKNIIKFTEIKKWKNTSNVLDWHANTTYKNKALLFQFDIVNFYPLITSGVLHNSVQFVKEIRTVSEYDIHINMQSRKTTF